MNAGDKYYLLQDVKAFAAPNMVWGHKGDQVRIISVCDNVVIVEGENKERFPTSITKLSHDKIQANTQHSTLSGMDVMEKRENPKLRRQKGRSVSTSAKHAHEYSLFQSG